MKRITKNLPNRGDFLCLFTGSALSHGAAPPACLAVLSSHDAEISGDRPREKSYRLFS